MDDRERRLQEAVERDRGQLASVDAGNTEIFKAKLEFFQHLMLLNAGTLSLIVTVTLALVASNHFAPLPSKGVSLLFIGCIMLIVSIMFSMLLNYLNVVNFQFQKSARACDEDALLGILNQSLSRDDPARNAERKRREHETISRYNRLSFFYELAIQFLTLAGYGMFVWSMESLLFHIAK